MKKYILSLLAIFTVAFGAKAADITDVLDNAWTGISGTTYAAADNLSASSDAVYSIQCAGGNSAIQLRTNNNNSGIVTTKSGGIAKTIKVTWNGNTNAARILQVYGSNTAYGSPSDLYDSGKQGTLIGEIDVNSSTLTLNDPDEYTFIGFKSKSGALYLDKVEIIWTTAGGNVVAKPTLTASQSFVESMTVEITSDYAVYYTLDGTDPTTSSTAYSEPFEITSTTTVKALAFDATTNTTSAVVSATYTALEKMTIAAAQAAEAGTEVFVEGDVVAAGDAGCVIFDGTDYIYYYAGSENTFQTGIKVQGVGKTSVFGGAKQLPAGSLTEIGASDFKETGTPLEVTGALLDQYVADAVTPRCYATFTGVLTVNGNYYNIAVEGAEEATASIIKPLGADLDAVNALDGSTVIVKGYLMYVNRKYVYFVATEVKERQTSVYNQDFESDDETNAIGIRTYAKDIAGSEVAQLQPVSGWTMGENGDAKSGGTYLYGSGAFLGGEGYLPPAFNLLDGETKALGILAVWSATSQYTQQVYLEPGKYMLQVPVYNAGGTGNINKNLISINGVAATSVSYPVAQWTVENIEFELTEATTVDVSVGYTAANSGSGAMPHLFIECARLVEGEEAIAAAKSEAEAAVEAFALKNAKKSALDTIDGYGVGDGLFFYPQSAIDEAKSAVENATSNEEIESALATLNSSMNKPAAGQPYAVKNVDAGINLNVTASAVNISKNAAVYFTEVEGGWAISSDIAGEGAEAQYEYIFKTTNNTWTLAATENLSEAYVISVNAVDGGYTLTGANGTIGLDNITEGSSCYANKAIGNHGVWTIEEWTAPVYYTVTVAGAENCAIVADPTEAEEGDVVTLTVTPDDEFVGEGFKKVFSVTAENSDLVVELTETETGYTFVMPADNVIVNGSIVSEGDFNYLIKNPMFLLHSNDGTNAYYDNWTLDPELPAGKERNYDEMNLVTYSGNVNFSITQTIPEIEPGQYRLSVYAFYRAGSAQDEANRVNNGDVTHNLNMFAEVGDAIYTQPIMNLYEGATEVDVTGKGNHCLVPGYEDLFVPDGASDSRSFYLAGYYRNDLIVNVVQKGEMMIGVNHPTGMAYDGDYAPIGGWELERIGDPVIEEDLVYEGYIATGAAVRDDPYNMISSGGEEQTVTITDGEDEGVVNIKFSGFTLPLPPFPTGEFTVMADKIVNSDGSIEYSSEGFTLGIQIGMMTSTFQGTLTGTQASVNDVPTLVLKLNQSAEITAVFAGSEEVAKSLLAEEYVEPVVRLEDGKYYLCNVATEKWWAPGNNWGTQASLLDHPDYITLISNDDGTYKMETPVNNGGTQYYFEGEWMDNGNPLPLTITRGDIMGYKDEAETDPVYTWFISNNGGYFGYNGSNTIIARNLTQDNENAVWLIFSEAELREALATATADDPVDATFLIIDQRFGRNRRDSSAWTNEGSCNLTGGNSNRHGAEKYHGEYNVYQTLVDAPSGVYKLEGQGFYRQDGSDDENLPVLYANDATSAFPILPTGAGVNDMNSGCDSFEAGKYKIDPVFVEVGDGGTLTIGTKLEGNTNLWVMWDNFSLTYYGPDATIEDVMFGDLINKLEELRDLAEEQLEDDDVSPATKTALSDALAATETVEPQTVENYEAAIATMTTPTEQAKVDINNKQAIDGMYRLMEENNVATADALATYKGLADDYLAKWEEGTLTETVVNPYAATGWQHDAGIASNQYLLSAWTDANGEAVTDYAKALYINTWSVEGENDGTEFKVPFYEYWTSDAASLGENTWTATVTGLEPGKEYTVSSWTRVRRQNDNTDTPYGISMNVNDGEPVDISTLEIVGGGPFFIGEFSITAVADENGELKINYVIAASNNISWLSFQKVNCSSEEESTLLEKTIDLKRDTGLGYNTTFGSIDVEEAKAFLGVDELTYDMLRIVNPDATEISDYAPFDGWFNGEGVAENWGSTTKINVKFFEAIPDGEFSICDMNGADVAGDTYTVKWALVANDKEIVYTINVTFVKPGAVDLEVGDVVATASVTYDKTDANYVEKEVKLSDTDVQNILDALGLSSLAEAKVYAYNPTTGELLKNYAGFDGWRDANGDFANWTGTAAVPACVKYTDGVTYMCYNISGVDAITIPTYWAIANDTKAVLVKIDFIYEEETGINAINMDDALLNGNVYDLSGRRVGNVVKGQIYIVNGKKVLVK